VFFSDFSPRGNAYQCCEGWQVSGSGTGGTSFTVATEFLVAKSGSISQIDVAVGYVSGVNSFYAALYTDNAGLPGTLLARWDNLSSNTPFRQCCGLVTVSGISGLNLSAGNSYFLVLGPMSVNDTSWEEWNLNSIGAKGLNLYSTDGGQNWNSRGQQTLGAFDVLGIPIR
jgi:Ca2+-binding RTX toxin-like protein